MFVCDYVNREWSNQRILPYSDIKVSPSSRVFHYGQAIFEGMKAYKDDNDGIWLFRPDENFKRFNISSKRLAIPEIPKKVFFVLIFFSKIFISNYFIKFLRSTSIFLPKEGVDTFIINVYSNLFNY